MLLSERTKELKGDTIQQLSDILVEVLGGFKAPTTVGGMRTFRETESGTEVEVSFDYDSILEQAEYVLEDVDINLEELESEED